MLLVDDQSLSTPETIVGCPCCVSRPMSARICVRRGARACTGVAAARQRLQQVTRRSNNERQRHPCASAAKVDDDDEFGPRASHRAKSADDVTYLRTPHGFVFWAVIIDIFSRFVVGWSVSAMNDRHLVLAALHMARGRRSPDPGLSITAIVAAHTQERTIRLC